VNFAGRRGDVVGRTRHASAEGLAGRVACANQRLAAEVIARLVTIEVSDHVAPPHRLIGRLKA
jgi:hypothetical protein